MIPAPAHRWTFGTSGAPDTGRLCLLRLLSCPAWLDTATSVCRMSASAGFDAAPARLLTPALLRRWAAAATEALAEHAEQINDLNVFPVPDGDTGTNSSMTFRAGLVALADLPADADAMTIVRTLGRAAALGAQGNSGVILSQMLRGILDAAVDPARDMDGRALAAILSSAADAGRDAVGDPRDGTMLSVASDAAAAARVAARTSPDLAHVCLAAADAARDSLIDTPNHLEVLAAAGVVDAGGRAIVVVLDALAEVVTDSPRPQWRAPILPRSCDVTALRAAYTGPTYEVMYVLAAPVEAIADVQSQLINLGDSLAVVGGDGLWNVHVHVDDPAAAIAIGHSVGSVNAIKVSYLLPDSDTALPAVVGVDKDIARIAHDAGFHVTAIGSLESVVADISAAAQSAGRSAALVVVAGEHAAAAQGLWQHLDPSVAFSVLPCHHLPQVLAAIAVYDGQLTVADNVAVMSAAAAGMRCASIHQGRDGSVTVTGGWRALPATDVLSAVAAAVTDLRDDSTEIVTVVYNAYTGLDSEELRATIAEVAGGCHVDVVDGGSTESVVSIGVE